MKLLNKLTKNTAVASQKAFKYISKNIAELYTMFALFLAVPAAVGLITDVKWGLLLSFTLQAIVGLLYIKGRK